MGTILFLALVVLLIIQFVIYKRNSSKFVKSEDEAKIEELLTALQSGMQRHTDKRGRTILMIACDEHPTHTSSVEGFFNVAKEAISSGIRVNERSLENGKTALAYAAAKPYNSNLIGYLIKTGADTSAKDINGQTPLFDSATHGDKDGFTIIADHTSDLNVADNEGNTPLMSAVSQMNIPIVRELIKRGVNVKLRNVNGESAHDIAANVKPKFIKHSQNSAKPNEYGKHNHSINELIRELHCLETDTVFKPKKYRPQTNPNFGDTGDFND